MRRTKEESQLTKERIIQASYELIREKGYEQMTRDDIAKKVGMTRGAVNWHFTSKEEIYLAALNKIIDDFQSERQKYFHDTSISPEEKIKRLIYMPIKMREEYRFINSVPEYMLDDPRFSDVVSHMAQNRKYFIGSMEKCLTEIEQQTGKVYPDKRKLAQILYFLHEGFHSNYAESAFEDSDDIQNNYQKYLSILLEI